MRVCVCTCVMEKFWLCFVASRPNRPAMELIASHEISQLQLHPGSIVDKCRLFASMSPCEDLCIPNAMLALYVLRRVVVSITSHRPPP